MFKGAGRKKKKQIGVNYYFIELLTCVVPTLLSFDLKKSQENRLLIY